MFETIKRLFKKEEPEIIEMSEEDIEKAKEYGEIAQKMRENGEITEMRTETGKLLGFFGPAGFEKVDSTYEEREMLHKVLKRLDKIESVLNIEK